MKKCRTITGGETRRRIKTMFQDKRGNWYRSKRIGRRVVREYLGRGEAWASFAWLEAHDRQRDADERPARQREEKQLEELEAAVAAVCTLADQAAREALEAAGYFQHDRGQWRKRRGKDS